MASRVARAQRSKAGIAAAAGLAALPGASGSTAPGASGSAAPGASPLPVSRGLAELRSQFERVVSTVSPSVVVIETSSGLGTRIIFDSSGNIVTNAHVVGNETQFAVTLADGRQMSGSLVGTFAPDDLAVIRVQGGSNLHPATFADSSSLVVGQIVMAIGNPLGLQTSVTEGIISALNRTVSESSSVTLPNIIQASAPINPGNCGGALVDLSGSVVGIPALAAVDQQIG